jgi:hypothetical protein
LDQRQEEMRQLYFWMIFVFLVFIINLFYLNQMIIMRNRREEILKGYPSSLQDDRCLPFHYKKDKFYNLEAIEKWEEMPQICLYMSTESQEGNHLFGQPNQRQMSWTDLLILDIILVNEKDINSFIEFGTLGGEITLYLGLVSKMRKGKLLTLDVEDSRSKNLQHCGLDNIQFNFIPNFYENMTNSRQKLLKRNENIFEIFKNENSMILFDGFKCQEIEVYLKHFQGHVFVIKDWNPQDYDCVARFLDDFDFVQIFENLVESTASNLRAFKRISHSSPST